MSRGSGGATFDSLSPHRHSAPHSSDCYMRPVLITQMITAHICFGLHAAFTSLESLPLHSLVLILLCSLPQYSSRPPNTIALHASCASPLTTTYIAWTAISGPGFELLVAFVMLASVPTPSCLEQILRGVCVALSSRSRLSSGPT